MLSITINVTWRTIMGALFIGAAVAVSSLTIVRAEHVKPDKKKTVYKCSTGTACLTGDSSGSKTYGIYAEGTGGFDALHAVTSTTVGNSAVAGISTGTSGTGHGVYGKSSNGDGVYGTSNEANGVYGTTNAKATTGNQTAGVYGTASTAPGVYGTSISASGVFGSSTDYAGVYGSGPYAGVIGATPVGASAESVAVLAASDSFYASIFQGVNYANEHQCTIDPDANLTCSGKISGGGEMLTRQRSAAGRRVLTYSAQAATPTIEDLGAAQMHDGIANVEIPADFASVIDRGNPYYVFLTPMGDTRGLYVSMENARGFQVRENMHGRSGVTFQYRIVGVPLDAKNVRLPDAPAMKLPPLRKLPPPVR